MPPRWLLPLVLAVVPAGAVVAQAPLPMGEPTPEPLSIVPSPTDPPAGPCDCLIPPQPCRPRLEPDYFQFLSGVSRTTSIGPNGPDIDFTPISARLGWYLTDPMAPGAVSVLLEGTAAVVTSGPGHWWSGPALILRYERRPDRVLVPYIQGGVGLAFNDIYRDEDQRRIGALTEFHEHIGAGLRYRIAPNWSFDVETVLEHISNADTARRNLGVTNVGVLAGWTYTFGGP
jgi:Lipid A 3-O-deacylase (PagL)